MKTIISADFAEKPESYLENKKEYSRWL